MGDALLEELNAQGMFGQGYAKDIAIFVTEKHMNKRVELMQTALSIVQRWCNEEDLTVNLLKTIMYRL